MDVWGYGRVDVSFTNPRPYIHTFTLPYKTLPTVKLLFRLLALFILLPAVELALLIQVDKLIGFWPTIGLILATGFIGGLLARREGLSVWRRLNQRLGEGGLPGKELLDGVIILLAGALLITPGVLTDVFGFLGLLPPTRALIRKIVQKRIERAVKGGTISMTGFQTGGSWRYTSTPPRPQESTQWQGTPHDLPRYSDEPGEGDRTK